MASVGPGMGLDVLGAASYDLLKDLGNCGRDGYGGSSLP